MKKIIHSVFVGANTSGRPLGNGELLQGPFARDHLCKMRDDLAQMAREARRAGNRTRVDFGPWRSQDMDPPQGWIQ